MSDLIKRLASLSPEKRAMLLEQLKKKQEEKKQELILPQKRETNEVPLSFAQQRLWFLNQLEPQSAFYNISNALHLSGRMYVKALNRSLTRVIQRHEVLRTTFGEREGHPVQIITPSVSPQSHQPLSVIDMSGIDLAQRDQLAHSLVRLEAVRPFSLAKELLLRATLLRLDLEEHLLVLTMHHIVSDGWSMGILQREIVHFFQAEVKGEAVGQASAATPQEPTLPELPIQYTDYALWQRKFLQGTVLQEQIDYWQHHLTGAPGILHLPTDRPRPPMQTYAGAKQTLLVPPALVEELKALSQCEETTLFMTLLTAFNVLLMRYSGQQDIVVGIPIANRTRSEVKDLIGFFVNTLAVRTDLSGNPSFRHLLARVRDVALKAFAHQDLPFEKLVEVLPIERHLGYSPLFQVLFVMQNAPRTSLEEELTQSGLSWRTVEVGQTTAKFDLECSLYETSLGLEIVLIYNTDLFAPATIKRLLANLQTLLKGVVQNPQARLSEVPLLTEAERTQILTQGTGSARWNATTVGTVPCACPPPDLCLHQLVEQQVERAPDSVALVLGEDEQLTYQELNAGANQIAHRLREIGIGPDRLVGVCMEPSLELVVALQAVLKAGGAYVPLDPSYPQERLTFMLEDAQVAVVLTQTHLLDLMGQAHKLYAKVGLICIASIFPAPGARASTSDLTRRPLHTTSQNQDNPACPVGSENLAYLIYTSGSTGQPKGVQVTHANVSRLFRATADHFRFQPSDVWTFFHSFAFDFSVWEIWGALHSGGRLVVVPHWLSRSPDLFWQQLVREQVTILNQTPSAFRQLIQVQDKQRTCLSTVIFGGEPLSLASLEPWVQCYGDEVPQLINMYGITETTVHVTSRRLYGEEIRAGAGSLIGRPLSDLQLYVLDEQQQLVPIGVAGEVYIAGAGLARGYLNRPDLTAERFVPHPFSSQRVGTGLAPVRGERLYRTGDLARYRETGELEYLGRIDRQVKLRGFRIELGEIEAVLRAHPAVYEAIVLATDGKTGGKQLAPTASQLVAYVVMHLQETAKSSDLRKYLQARLPNYMVPSHFVMLDALPLSPNGKIDRRALPEPDDLPLEHEATFVGPRTPLEELLTQIWMHVLSCSQVGIHDNFFELGGHSLLATQVVSRIRQALNRNLPLRTLFEAPTIAELAPQIETSIRAGQESILPALEAHGERDDSPLSFAQERLWFLQQLEPESSAYNIPLVLHTRGPLSLQVLSQSLATLVQRHEALRTTFPVRSDQPMQVIAPWSQANSDLTVLIDVSSLDREAQECQIRILTQQEEHRPFDLAKGPLLRFHILRKGLLDHVLLFVMHHIVSDGWSMRVLEHEMTVLYEAKAFGKDTHRLPPLPVQYRDYALWQREFLQGEVLEAELSYWQRQLKGVPGALNLPTDHPRPAVQTYRGASQEFWFSPSLTAQLGALGRQENVTLFMILLASLQVLLARYSGQSDICVGTPIANRRHSQIEGLIGFFVNTLVMRTNLRGNPTFLHVLQQVREVCLQAYTHQESPFEKVVEALQPERDLSRSPLFQVMLALQNTPQEGKQEPIPVSESLIITPLITENITSDVAAVTSKFDLTLYLTETEQGMHCVLEYSTDLFKADTITRMLDHWHTLLQGILQDPQVHLSALPLLSSAEREQMLVAWNATKTDHQGFNPWCPQGVCVHQLFEQQVERTPESIAVAFGEEQQVSYQQLNEQANQLAHRLLGEGIGPDRLVGVCMEPSLELVGALLAVLKAGGAYVPLDPRFPQDRLTYMLKDAQVSVVLTQSHLIPILPVAESRLICLDVHWEGEPNEPSSNPVSQVMAENLAYMVYTSGSTGVPKGAGVYQRGLMNLLTWFLNAFHITAQDQVLVVTSFSFDLTQKNLLAPLLVGGTVNIQPGSYDSSLICQSLTERSISLLNCTPSMFYPLLEECGKTSFDLLSSLRCVFLGGEPIALSRLRSWMQSFQCSAQVFNTYGPTECSDVVAFSQIDASDLSESTTVPIGHPISNVQLLILDDKMELVPPLVKGELYVAGQCLGAGYRHQSHLTATNFVPNPFREVSGSLLYKTGDFARYRSDGAIEFLGRIDHQVKLRGFRIELGEIEATLRSHPAVQEAVVVLHEESEAKQNLASATSLLVAYVVPRTAASLTAAKAGLALALREHLRGQLPYYMIPTRVILLETLPLTPNGKVDRVALGLAPMGSVVDLGQAGQKLGQVALYTPLQELLASIWKDVLHQREVGIHDSFFELGGHSLLATQVVSRIRQAINRELPLRTLFEAPTIAQLAQQIETSIRAGQGSVLPALEAHGERDDHPLSFAQERLWFLQQLEPESSAYNIPLVLHVHGPLSLQALAQSLTTLVQRHEALRTTFPIRSDQPVQVIAPWSQVNSDPTVLIDVSSLDIEVQERQIRILMQQEEHHPFDLAKGPLLRFHVLRKGLEDHVLLFVMHHIISDGWSMRILEHEVTVLYESSATGKITASLPPLPIQYRDYALWQREWLAGEVLDAELSYWQQQLKGASEALNLPTDHPRPAVQTYRGAHQELWFEPTLTVQLVALGRQENVTLFMILLASLQVFLLRYCGQDDICVGTPIANRRHTQIEDLIGFFVNTLVLRTNLSGNPTFLHVLQQLREVCLQAYAHQDIPFEKVVEALQPERNLSHAPLFQVMLILQNVPGEAEHSPRPVPPTLITTPLSIESTTSKFDLTFILTESLQGLHCTCEYNTDLFEADSIRRMLTNFQTLLEGVVQNPQARLSDLPLLSPAEQEQLVVAWNTSQRDYPQEMTVHQLFEQQVERTPDAVALVCEEEVLTYAELNRRTNQLAHHLQKRGIGPDMLVGLYLQRSRESVLSLMAVLKAGGAYLPLDPASPGERLRLMLADTPIVLILTREHLLSRLPQHSCAVMDLDACWSDLGDLVADNPRPQTLPDHLAYGIFTSGSTGQPKGVLGSHRGLLNRLYWMQERSPFQAGERCCHKTALPFVDAVTEVLAPLLFGVPLTIIAEEIVPDAARLVEVLRTQGITRLVLVPSLLRGLVEQAWPLSDQLPDLQLWMCSGEVLPTDLLRQFQQSMPGDCLLNLYGSSEVAADATCYEPSRGESLPHTVPVGYPIANTRLYVLDPHGQVVPVGVTGEVYVGGVGLARGYSSHPDWTAERFQPDALSGLPGERLYRTGDLARPLPDGAIEWVGRIDQQVKLRGLRIELGEIESVLHGHPAVDEAIVLAKAGPAGEKQLVAYVVSKQQEAQNRRDFRAYLQARLPDSMVPARFVLLDAFPLLSNGKVDRQALPTPTDLSAEHQESFVGPRTPLEELLSHIWMGVLGVISVGIHDNFFELGGHSLLATRLVARVRTVLGLEMPLRAVFEAPTVAEFARLVEQAFHNRSSIEIPPLAAMTRPKAIPLSFGQQRLWFLDQLEQGSTAYLISQALRLQGNLDAQALEQSLQELLDRHESLRTTFELRDRVDSGLPLSGPVQVIHPAREGGQTPPLLPVIDLQRLSLEGREQEMRQLTKQEAQHPCDLVLGPLLRIYLLRIDRSDGHVLLLTLHHIITDGWSNAVLMREMTTLYQSKVLGQSSPLAPLPIQYADYALWQRQHLQGVGSGFTSDLSAQMAYWRKQLAGVLPLALPTDYPRKALHSYRGAREERRLPEGLSAKLLALSQKAHVTLFMLLLTAFQVLLARYSQQQDITVGTPIANRTSSELEGVIGFFVNTLVMRTDLSGNPRFEELLTRVREVCLGAYTHQDIPFEKVVEEMEPERDLSRSPLFQVFFQFQNAVEAGQAQGTVPTVDGVGTVDVKPLALESQASLFDLTLSVSETNSGGLHMALVYCTDLFKADTITRMLAHFQVLLEGIVQNPQANLSDLPLLTEAEREQLLVEWNATRSEYQEDVCLHQLFEQQVERTSDAVALVFEDEMLTYAELDRRANQLASTLQALGVGPDALVGVCLQRGLAMALAVLAILKADGAVVPIDTELPKARIAYLLADAQISVLLTQHQVQEQLPDLPAQTVLDGACGMLIRTGMYPSHAGAPVRAAVGTGARRDRTGASPVPTAPVHDLTPEHLCYVIYTSGSTGTPKGVGVPHRVLVNLMAWHRRHLLGGVRMLQFARLSFDVSFYELFATWSTGGMLFLVAASMRTDVVALARFLHERAIEKTKLPVVMLHQLAALREDWAGYLQEIITAGEQLQIIPATRALFEHLEDVTLHNHYGPSETHVATAHTLKGPGSEWPMYPPIGRPIANTDIYLLDTHSQPVPIGVVGELYIGGMGRLARGYIGRADLTAERFVPYPFASVGTVPCACPEGVPGSRGTAPCACLGGARLYRTGDLARYLPDGTIEYVGRRDHQVKLRGFRIEPGEIEATMMGHPAIESCVVLVREDRPGEKRLVAYYVVRRETEQGGSAQGTTPTVLRSYLQDRLPAYMIPATFVLLDTLPLIPNGKVDRRALATKALPQDTKPEVVVAPRTPVEKALAAIWQDLLHLEQVSISDNFFALGGHSLLAVQLLNRMNKQFGLSLSLASLFQVPTIEQAAALLQKDIILEEPSTPAELRPPVGQGTELAQGTGQEPALSAPTAGTSSCVLIQPLGEKTPFFWVHPGYGDVYCYLDLAKHLRHDRPFYGIQAPGLRSQCDPANGAGILSPQVFNSVEEMATSYVDEILAIQPDSPYFLAGYSFGGLVAFEMARQLEARDCSVALLALLDSYPREQGASPSKDYAEPIVRIIERLGWKDKVSLSYEELACLQPDAQLAYLLERLREAQLVPEDMDNSQLWRYIKVHAAHASHSQNYRPQPYTGRITLFRSEAAEEDPALWMPFSAEPVEVHTVSGDHYSMVYEPCAAPLAAHLQQCLDEVDRT